MDTAAVAGEGDEPDQPDVEQAGEEESEPKVHFATGRLNSAQAEVVTRWRRVLQSSDSSRWGAGGLPRASTSDCIAAAIVDLLDRKPPQDMDLVRYTHRTRTQQRDRQASRAPAAPSYSFYLLESMANRVDEVVTGARKTHIDQLDEIREQVDAELPPRKSSSEQRAFRYIALCGQHGVPLKAYKIPPGMIARLAIDRWSRHDPGKVVTRATAYAETVHEQLHRSRRDMGIPEP